MDLETTLAERESILDRLRAALIKQLRLAKDPDELDPDVSLFGSGLALDSLDAVEVIVCLENEFGIHAAETGSSPAQLRTLNTIVDLVIEAAR